MDEEEMQSANEVASGTFWGLVGNGALKVISFLYVIYIARVVSQNEIGLFYFAISILGLFGAWKTLGLPVALTRYIPYFESRGEHGKARSLFKCTLAINIATGVLVCGLFWFGADAAGQAYQSPGLPEALRLIALVAILDNVFTTGTSFLQGRADIKSMQLAINAQTLFKFIFTITAFTMFGANLATLTLAYLASYAAAIIVSSGMVYGVYSRIPKGGAELSRHELLHEIAPFGIMLTIVSILWTVVSYSDRVVLGFFLPSENLSVAMAIYSMAIALAFNIMVFPATVGGIFMPIISRMVGKEDHAGIRRTMATAHRWVLFITLPFAAVMIAFSGEMLAVFYGSQYESGAQVMVIFCIGLLFSVFSYIISLTLAGMRMVALEFKIALLVLTVNIALCFALIPAYGVNGAALSSAASFVLSAAVFVHYGKKIAGYAVPAEIYKICAAGTITCALLFAAKSEAMAAAAAIPIIGGPDISPYASKVAYLLLLGAVTAIAFGVFAVISLFAKCFGEEDILVMKQAAARIRMPKGILAMAEKIIAYGIPGNGR